MALLEKGGAGAGGTSIGKDKGEDIGMDIGGAGGGGNMEGSWTAAAPPVATADAAIADAVGGNELPPPASARPVAPMLAASKLNDINEGSLIPLALMRRCSSMDALWFFRF